MSGRIRRGLTTALESIQAYTKNATQIMKEDVDEDTAGKLGVEKANLESAIALIAELDDKWGSYIDSLEAPQKMAEESVYMSFPYKAGRVEDGKEVPLSQRHFLDQNQFAREVLNMIKETIKSLERSRTNSRQSALSENNHSVDLNEEINNVGIENLNARMNQLEMNNARRNNTGTLEIVREKPDIMIGIKQFWKFFISKEKEILPGLYSIQTVFGTMTAGESDFGHNSKINSMSLVAVHASNNEHLPMPDAVEDVRSLESTGPTFTAEIKDKRNQRSISTLSGETDAPLPIDLLIPRGTISLNFDSSEEWEDETRLPPARLQTVSSPTVGEVVLVEEDFRTRNLWPMGKATELNVSGSIKMANGRIVTRPVSRLYPLEVKQMEEEINEREIESNENMNGTLMLELDSKKDENPSQTKPKVEKQAVKPYPMVTWPEAKLEASTMVALCLVCLLNITVAIKSCSICLIHGTLMGIMVLALIGNQKIEICCDVQNLSYELPTKMIWTDYHSVAKFWKSSRDMFQTEMTYPALNECLLLDSPFGVDMIVNPSCNPSPTVFWALVTLTAFFGLCSVLTLCRSCHENFRTIVAIGGIGCRCWKWKKRKTAYTRARAKETIKDKKGKTAN
uniref:DUF5641 domain-containing protein n=1 Tax=Meloidogyne javanica TaxID=6303 RepID=A0A915M2S3_MELJA